MADNANPYAQIMTGMVPDAIHPYQPEATGEKSENPYASIMKGESPQPLAQPSAQGQPALATYTPPEEPKAQPSWQQGVAEGIGKFGEGLKKDAYALPYIGEPIKEVGEAISNVNKAKHEAIGGKNQEAHPLQAAGAAITGALGGAAGAVEAPLALIGDALRYAPPAVIANLLSGKKPIGPSYNELVGGKPVSRRISELAAEKFPNQPASRGTGEMIGGLAPVIPGVNAVEGKALGQLLKNPNTAKIVEALGEVASKNPITKAASGIAHGAAEGAGLGAIYGAGGRAAAGEAPTVSPQDIARGAVYGAALRPVAEGVAGHSETPKKISEIAKSKEGESKVTKTVTGKVLKPQEKAETTSPMKPEDFNPRVVSPALEQTYNEIGKTPAAIAPSEEEGNEFERRMKVPLEELKERHPETKEFSEPFDASHNEPRVVEWKGTKYGAEPNPYEEGHATLGAKVGKKSEAEILERGKRGVWLAQQLREASKNGLTPAQWYANERGLQEKSPAAQREILQKASDFDKQTRGAIDVIENNDMAAAKKMAEGEETKKIGNIKKPGEGTLLYSDPLLIGPMYRLAKASGESLPEVAKLFSDELPTAVAKFAKMHDTLDRIKEGSDNMGDNVHERLWHNIAGEAHDTRGLKLEGVFGQEARQAIRNESPEQIMSEDEHPDWTEEQRKQVATKKIYRMDTKQLIANTLAQHGEAIHPEYEKALKDYASEQYGHRSGKYHWGERLLDDLTGNAYNAFFRFNPAFHGLIAAHPLQMGTAVAGVENIANAYKLLATNPQVRKYYGDMRGVTEDVRSIISEERHQQRQEENKVVGTVNKPLSPRFEKDIPTGRVNNEVIHLAGMLKKANEMYGGKGLEALKKMEDGSLPREDALELQVAGLKALRDATGGGTFGMNRTMLQDLPIAKHLAQLSGYKHVVARYQSKLAQQMAEGIKSNKPGIVKDALGSFATLTGATILLGGHAVINKELEEPLAATIGPQNLYAIEQALDMLNVPDKIGINLTDHMQYSLLNYGENAVLNNMGQLGRDLIHLSKEDPNRTPAEKYTDMLGHLFMMSKLSAPLGVGLSTWMKAKQGIYSTARGQKPLNIYSKDWMSPSVYPESKNTMTFDIGDFLYKIFAPGIESREANTAQKAKFEKYYKKYAPEEELPGTMESDYPTPGIERASE